MRKKKVYMSDFRGILKEKGNFSSEEIEEALYKEPREFDR